RVIQTSYSAEKIELFGTLVSVSRLGAFIVAILAAAILYFLLMKTRIGMDIRAVSQDPEAAVLMGINDKKIFTITFGLGVGLVGIAATIITPIYYIFPTVGESFSTISFIVVVLGGLGSFHGALIGGFLIGIVEAVGGIITSAEWARVFSLLIFLFILFVKPSGIMGKNARV
ncbi:MAG TPA: branched-chain amino acid ABC transporter permease, partial [Clostridiales bacterium]|nr:branched-chain amino acid ABC transporter permease [Clostridiales bacterium]